jgi:uncharacterized protein YkwD
MHIRSLVLALVCSLGLPGAALAAAGDPVPDPEEKAFCRQINTYRAQNGVPALKLSVSLTKEAEWHAGDMARKDYFDHTDSLRRSFSTRFTAFGYSGSTKGENIAGGSATGLASFNQFKSSSAHRKNMLSPSFKVLGIGRAFRAGTMLGWYWSTSFGRTADRTIAC